MQRNPYEKYQQQSVMTMTQGEMLTRLYDEVIKQLSAAKAAIESGDTPRANASLQKAQKIISHLSSTLNYQYAISKNLSSLYEYFVRRLIHANIRKDASAVDEILPMVQELREAFVQADRQARTR